MESKNPDFAPLLIVEDEEDHARMIRRSLQVEGKLANPLFWVRDGEDAIHFLTHKGKWGPENAPRPGLILLDIKLPLKDGFEVLSEIKADPDLKAIPVVILTTTSNSDDIRKAMLLGANDFIVKPVIFDDFTKKVGRLGHYWAFVSATMTV